MIERAISIALLLFGGTIISYATGLFYHAAQGEGARLLASGALLGMTLIVLGIVLDRDRRRPAAARPAVLQPIDEIAAMPAPEQSEAASDAQRR